MLLRAYLAIQSEALNQLHTRLNFHSSNICSIEPFFATINYEIESESALRLSIKASNYKIALSDKCYAQNKVQKVLIKFSIDAYDDCICKTKIRLAPLTA